MSDPTAIFFAGMAIGILIGSIGVAALLIFWGRND